MTGGLDQHRALPLVMDPVRLDPAHTDHPLTQAHLALTAVARRPTVRLAQGPVTEMPTREPAGPDLAQAALCPAHSPRLAHLAAGCGQTDQAQRLLSLQALRFPATQPAW